MSSFKVWVDWISFLFGDQSEQRTIEEETKCAPKNCRRVRFDSDEQPKCLATCDKDAESVTSGAESENSVILTTHFICKVNPPQGITTSSDESHLNQVEVEYKRRASDGTEKFSINGTLKDILPDYSEDESHENTLNYVEDFFSSLLYIVQKLECKIWCNGFIFEFHFNLQNRLQILKFDLEPLKVILRVDNLKEVKVNRSSTFIQLVGIMDSVLDTKKAFCVFGESAADVRLVLPKNGTIVFEFPSYDCREPWE